MTTAVVDQAAIDATRLRNFLALRHKARTDPWYLMGDILGYRDIEREVHGPIIDAMPKFYGGKDVLLTNGSLQYTPTVPLWEMTGKRKRLILYPRGHLKTSVISQAGTIQWILNYPHDIRILITTATGDLSALILSEIKSHFQYNERFRFLFPDYCPQKSIKDWGNAEQFSVLNRNKAAKRETTCSVSSIGKSVTGKHFEVLVCSDMVDEQNSKTPGGIREAIDHFQHMDPLLERKKVAAESGLPNHGWVTVEGTSYAFADLYSKIIESQGFRITSFGLGTETQQSDEWTILHGAAEVDPKAQTTLWPSRFPWSELKKIERTMGPSLYSSQYLNKPMSDEGGLCREDQIGFFNADVYRQVRAQLRIHATVDLAGMEAASKGDFSVLTVAGYDRDGRCYVLDIRRGHFTPTEVIGHIFDIHSRYSPFDIKIEKDAHARVLGHFLARECQKRQIFPNIVEIRRDNRTSKVQRIKGLEPWFHSKIIRFYDQIECKTDLVREIVEFPSSRNDDILDTIADQMQNRDGGVNYDVIPNEPDNSETMPFQSRKILAFNNSKTGAGLAWFPVDDAGELLNEAYHTMTGL